jgi:hypothetical protein
MGSPPKADLPLAENPTLGTKQKGEKISAMMLLCKNIVAKARTLFIF